ncbi:MAG: 30S ribosomal protein S12 methylthiotransferase RimO [Verrucomicrobiae bacterium]|nr:30S ribosomal protein S12 methylthiotransferase RimO [Verrucomicrobiae bacterium]
MAKDRPVPSVNPNTQDCANAVARKPTREMTSTDLRVSIVTLGCPKNLVDTEVIAGNLLAEGVQITNAPADADAVIINTCAFIDAAKEENIDVVLELAAARDRIRPTQAIVVAGCLPQRFAETLMHELPEVDAFMGIDQIPKIGAIVRTAIARRRLKVREAKSKIRRKSKTKNPDPDCRVEQGMHVAPLFEVSQQPHFLLDHTTARLRLTPRHYAYVKIADGCDNRCSYCTIPLIRGSYRSRTVEDIVAEAEALLADGAKELNLISQDTTLYGHDLRRAPRRAGASQAEHGSPNVCTLLRALDSLPGEFWIRLLYTHPAHWTDELIHTFAECKKVVRYVDLPLQHINDSLLEQMHRRIGREQIVDLIGRIRRGIPGVVIRTSFIVGFPGETREQFEELLGFVRAMRFERLGVFTYSREDGTRAASLPGHVPATVKRARADKLMRAQREIARQVAETYVGRVIKVLVEGRAGTQKLPFARAGAWEHGPLRLTGGAKIVNRKSEIGNVFLARSEADAPEIDGVVLVRAGKTGLQPGRFAWVKIVGHTDYDLLAEPL